MQDKRASHASNDEDAGTCSPVLNEIQQKGDPDERKKYDAVFLCVLIKSNMQLNVLFY